MPDNVTTILLDVQMKTSGIQSGVGQIQKSLKNLTIPKDISDNLTKGFEKLNPLLKEYQKQLSRGISNKKDLDNFNTLSKKIDETFGEIEAEYKKIDGKQIRFKTDVQEITKLKKELADLQSKLELKTGDIFKSNQSKGIIQNGVKELQEVLNTSFSSGNLKFPALSKIGEELSNAFSSSDFSTFNNKIAELKDRITSLSSVNRLDLAHKLGMKDTITDVDKADRYIVKFLNDISLYKPAVASIDNIKTKITETKDAIKDMESASSKRGFASFQEIETYINGARQSMLNFDGTINDAGNSAIKMADQVKQLQKSTEYFFGLRNMVNLLKRGAREAFNVIKELDAAMTETAVVTTYSVGDMWDMLPEYTANANALGASVLDMYKATTLYYQQGLENTQALGLANETLKMAKIAGLEAADATDAMTAALRGFNMEINEMSAQRINDVYSEVAARSASDVEELSTAMEKTASLAHSAGMSFEGTTAFLAQMIETTREAPENLGTAMKTIIARFQEMKKNPLEIVEVEGEEVSYNKIDEALQSIGVSLKDANGQFRNLDEVFLEISSKWDSLTQTQQRYIATTAAGSRQQSRFIAMMSDYNRTVELMEYANNSAGASQEQFNKTLESLETKLNKLKNAWNAFLMNITNNVLVKFFVDGLTKGVGAVNSLIDTLSFGSGVLKSFLSLFAAFHGLKFAGKVVNFGLGKLGGFLGNNVTAKTAVDENGNLVKQYDSAQAQAIYRPIVEKLSTLIEVTRGKNAESGKQVSTNTYKDAQARFTEMRKNRGNYTTDDLIKAQSGLSPKELETLMKSNPAIRKGIETTITRAAEKKGIKVDANDIKLVGTGKLSLEDFNGKYIVSTPLAEQWKSMSLDDPKRGEVQKQLNEEFKKYAHSQGIYQGNNPKEYAALKEKYINGFSLLEGESFSPKETDKIVSGIQTAGAAVSQFGMGIQNVGVMISQVNPMLGNMVSTMGSLVSSVGMGISGIGSMADMIGGPATLAITAVTAAIGAAIYFEKKRKEEIRKEAEEVTNSYKEANEAHTKNISSLKSWKDDFITLSKGVDKNGNNVNLSAEEYDHYLEIVNTIAEINPDIVEGYNAQGQAIITNNKALEETLRLEEERAKLNRETYTSTASLNKLIENRNIDEGYIKAIGTSPSTPYTQDLNNQGIIVTGNGQPLYLQTNKVKTALQNSGLDEDLINPILQKYGIKSLNDLDKESYKFQKHYQEIENDIDKLIASDPNLEWDKGLMDSFSSFADDKAAFDQAVQPIYEQLATSISDNANYQQIDAELKPVVQDYLKQLAGSGLSGAEMQKQSEEFVKRYAKQVGEGSRYKELLAEADTFKKEYAKTLDADAYKNNIEETAQEFEKLADAVRDTDPVLAEFYENAAARARNFTENTNMDLSSALNSMSAQFAAAEGALDRFNEATEKDFSTAAEGYKSILDQVFEEKNDEKVHTLGYGDQTFWTGAKELLGADAIKDMGVDDAIEAMERIQPMLEDGTEGWAAFYEAVKEAGPELENIAGVKIDEETGFFSEIPADKWHEVAKAMKMSDETFSALMSKARQWTKMDFVNYDSTRAIFASNGQGIVGQKNEEGQADLYVKQDTMVQELLNVGYTWQEIPNILKNMAANGIHVLPSAEEVTKGQLEGFFKSVDIENTEGLIETLIKTNDYTKEEIRGLVQKADEFGIEGIEYDENFDEQYAELDVQINDPELAKQTNELQNIRSIVDAIAEHEGIEGSTTAERRIATEALISEIEQNVYGDKDNENDSIVDKFRQFKDVNGNTFDINDKDSLKSFYDTYGTLEDLSKSIDVEIGKLDEEYKTASDLRKQQIEGEKEQLQESQKYIDESLEMAKEGVREQRAEQGKKLKSNQVADSLTKNINKDLTSNITGGITKSVNEVYESTTEEKTVNETVTATVDPSAEEARETLEDIEEKDGKKSKMEVDVQTTGDTQVFGDVPVEDKGATITVTGVDKYTSVINQAEAELSGLPSTKNVTIGASLSTSFGQTINSALSKIAEVIRKGNSVKVGPTVAKGMNQPHYSNSIPSVGSLAKGTFGSAASGGKGRLGPKGKGGLTLTGEEGYEIAWLPDKNRSMILGAGGPQMVNLPSNAVVWTHKESEEILKRRGIDAGSLRDGVKISAIIPPSGSSGGTSKSNSKNSGKGSSSTVKGSGSNTVIINFSMEEVYRYNLEKRIDHISNAIDQRSKTIEKLLDRIGTKTSDISGHVSAQISALNSIKTNNNSLANSYLKSLKTLDTGNYKEKISWSTGGKSNKEDTVNLSKYIKNNNGQYEIDYNALNKEKDRAKREAIFKAAQSALDPLVNGLQSARKAAQDAQDQIDELKQQVTDTFYTWENELTRIYNATQKLDNLSSYRDRFAAEVEKQQAKLSAGTISLAEALKTLNGVRENENSTIRAQLAQQQELINAQKARLASAISAEDEIAEYNRLVASGTANNNNLQVAEDRMKAANLMLKYLDNIQKRDDGTYTYNIKYEQLEKDRLAGNISEETYNSIKDGIEELNSAQTDTNNAITEGDNLVAEINNQVADYKDYIVSMEDELLKGLEEEIKTEIDNNKKLSDSISNAMKDLLDKVKKILDLRRRQEDNQKTQNDISKKQQRLAMLRADTSGGHATEIAQLEKEIGDAQQSYQRTLEDQMLQDMQTQADEAKAQRERQIELAQAQLDISTATGENMKLVATWLSDPEKYQTEIKSALEVSRDVDEKGYNGQAQALDKIDKDLYDLIRAVVEVGGNTDSLKAIVDEQAKDIESLDNQNTKDNSSTGATNISGQNTEDKKQGYLNTLDIVTKDGKLSADDVKQTKTTANQAGYSAKTYIEDLAKKTSWKETIAAAKAAGWSKYKMALTWSTSDFKTAYDAVYGKGSYDKFRTEAIKKKETAYVYKTGGLADYTGPAWLDGTKSRPELVLNAQDTKNFIALKDILSNAMRSTSNIPTSTAAGDTTYEININVDHLNNDYDVDKVAERVKKIIVKDSSYRNVTQVRNFR